MRKIVLLLLAGILLCPILSSAQTVTEGKVKVGKDEKSGFVVASKFDKDLVADALAGMLNEAGLKKHGKKKKFYTFMGVEWPAISPNKVDVYYKVQKKKHKSRIYFVVSKGYDNYITTATDATTAANITAFLAKIDPTVEHNEEIKQKEAEVKAMNDKLEADKAALKKAEEDKKRKEKELETMRQNK